MLRVLVRQTPERFDHDHARRRLCDSCEALAQSVQELRALQVRQHNYVRVLGLRLTPYLHLQTAHPSLPPIQCLIWRIHLHTQPLYRDVSLVRGNATLAGLAMAVVGKLPNAVILISSHAAVKQCLRSSTGTLVMEGAVRSSTGTFKSSSSILVHPLHDPLGTSVFQALL